MKTSFCYFDKTSNRILRFTFHSPQLLLSLQVEIKNIGVVKYIKRHNTQKVWFARWARSPWAVFRSLSIVVHIQNMAIGAFKDSLLQQPGSNKQDAINLFSNKELLALLLDWDLLWLELEDDLLQNELNLNLYTEVAPAGQLQATYSIPIVCGFNCIGRDFFMPKL